MAQMLYIEDTWRYTGYLASAIILVLSVAFSLAIGHYFFTSSIVPVDRSPSIPGNSIVLDNLIALGVVFALLPIAFVSFTNFRYLKSVETNIPRFLRDILQSTDSGLILPKALIEAAKRDYGPVSYEMGIAMTKFTMGYDFSRSIMEACQNLKHPYAPQVGQIISEAYSAGGKMHEVLSSSVNLFNDLDQYNQQRESELRPYTQLVYISIGIYLVIALIVINSFIGPYISTIQNQAATTSSITSSFSRGFNFNSLPQGGKSYFISVFYISSLMESVFGGMVAGKIVDRSAAAGLRHSIILIAITIVAFSLLGRMLGYPLFP